MHEERSLIPFLSVPQVGSLREICGFRVCLVGPPTVTEFEDREVAESDVVRVVAEHAPVGILSLAAILEQNGLSPQVVDLNYWYYEYLQSEERTRNGLSFHSFAQARLEHTSADVFGFSTLCSSFPLTLRIADSVKRSHPNAKIVLGGPQASVVDVKTMQVFDFIDCVVRGEAEETFPVTLAALANGQDLSGVPGITFRRGEDIIRNRSAPAIRDLDALPLPAFHLYPHLGKCRYVPLELGRGCPFACTFCSTNDFFRRNFRLKSPARTIEHMKLIKQTYGVSTFDLIHDMFTVDRKRVAAFCEALLACGERFHWNCSARTDCIDEELIELMSRAGCRGIFFGIETGSSRMQRIVQKNLDLDEAMRMIACNDTHQIRTAVSLITGFPDETRDDLRDTVGFVMDSLRFDYAEPQLHILAPLAETPIHSQYRDQLTFDYVFSDMSHQGWRQDPADQSLIRSYPDIFPNFYAVPNRNLDRRHLKELVEFILHGVERFRWLLVALHQDSGDLVEVFDRWRAWRTKHQTTSLSLDELNIYYGRIDFRQDFLRFVQDEYLTLARDGATAIQGLLDYECGIRTMTAADPNEPASADTPRSPDSGKKAEILGLTSIPRRARGVHVGHLQMDYEHLIECLRNKENLRQIPQREVTLAIRTTEDSRSEVIQLAELSAKILVMCDGIRTVKQIADHFAVTEPPVGDISPEKVCLFGLELLRQQGLVVAHPFAGSSLAAAG